MQTLIRQARIFGARGGVAGLLVLAFLVGAQVADAKLSAVIQAAASGNGCGGTQNDYWNGPSSGQSAGHYDHGWDGYCPVAGGWYYSYTGIDSHTCYGGCAGFIETWQKTQLKVYNCADQEIFNQGAQTWGTASIGMNSQNGGEYWNCGYDSSYGENYDQNIYDWYFYGSQP
jgi:hypothetical protein